MTNDSIIDFWMQTQSTVVELSLKKGPLAEGEAMMHSSMCRALEEYFRIQTILLEVERHGLSQKFKELLDNDSK